MSGASAGVFVRGVVVTSAALAAAALSHMGWWLEWHTRVRPGEASRPVEASEPA